MSGECEKCGEHCVDCECKTSLREIMTESPFEIKVWAQMFFEDGSVSQGLRVPETVYDDETTLNIIAERLLTSVNREEGYMLIWGAGEIRFLPFLLRERR